MFFYMAVPRQVDFDAHNSHISKLMGLETFEWQGVEYVGKRVETYASLEELGNMESHLHSIMKRLQVKRVPIRLIAYAEINSDTYAT